MVKGALCFPDELGLYVCNLAVVHDLTSVAMGLDYFL